MCAQLSSHVLESPCAREFLVFLGFDFQKDGAHEKDPFVVFPHWDPDETLTMTSQVLPAVCGKGRSSVISSRVRVVFELNVKVIARRAEL